MKTEQLYEIYKNHPVVTTDSRNCPAGSIFFALKGETFNGNVFAAKALEQGCAYAVIDEKEFAVLNDERYILVENVLESMQSLASWHRAQCAIPVLQITGTNGKTTTKELVAAVLQKRFRVLYTKGNLNNHIGVPLTLLQLTSEHEMAVVETGANHPGEIDLLSRIVQADWGLITNVGRAHLEGFGSFEGVVRTKGELYDYLREKGGRIFLHADNEHLVGISSGLECVRYGLPADGVNHFVEGRMVQCTPFLEAEWRVNGGVWHTTKTQLIGAYNLSNVLAAVAVGAHFGVSEQQIDEALAGYVPGNNRSQFIKTEDNQLVVDAYNANPTSMMAALENFEKMEAAHKMVILGEMRELGADSVAEHKKIIDFLTTMHLEQVWLVGSSFAGLYPDFRCFNNVDEVKETLATEKPNDVTILIKGSNGTRLFTLPEFL